MPLATYSQVSLIDPLFSWVTGPFLGALNIETTLYHFPRKAETLRPLYLLLFMLGTGLAHLFVTVS